MKLPLRGLARPVAGALIALLAAANAAVFVLHTLPRRSEGRSLAATMERKKSELAAAEEQSRQIEERFETLELNGRDQRRFYGEVINGRDATLLPVLAELNGLAQELRLQADSLSVDPEEVKDSRLTRLQIKMPVQGTYRQILQFLERLERSEHFLVVDELGLRNATLGGGGQAELNIDFSTYFLAEGAGDRES